MAKRSGLIRAVAFLVAVAAGCTPKIQTGISYPMKWGNIVFEDQTAEKFLTNALRIHARKIDLTKISPAYFIDVINYADRNDRDGRITEEEAIDAYTHFAQR